MAKLSLVSECKTDVTLVSNRFIDCHMRYANGEFVKIYLYLLRCTTDMPDDFSLFSIADNLNLTESDVLRALRYWEKEGLLSLDLNQGNQIQSIHVLEEQTTQKATKSALVQAPTQVVDSLPAVEELTAASNNYDTTNCDDAIQAIVLIAEQYLKRQLTSLDFNRIVYFYEDLHFSADLIEYLFEHCATIGNRSIRYIESVAIAWADKGILTVKQAKEEGQQFKREYFTIIKAFGIRNRTPIDNEIRYMQKWLEEYHFTTDVIAEACSRTIVQTGSASFPYADSILKNWREQGILAKKDIQALDSAHHLKKSANQQNAAKQTAPPPKTKFNNFEQRNSYDFDQLENLLNHT